MGANFGSSALEQLADGAAATRTAAAVAIAELSTSPMILQIHSIEPSAKAAGHALACAPDSMTRSGRRVHRDAGVGVMLGMVSVVERREDCKPVRNGLSRPAHARSGLEPRKEASPIRYPARTRLRRNADASSASAAQRETIRAVSISNWRDVRNRWRMPGPCDCRNDARDAVPATKPAESRAARSNRPRKADCTTAAGRKADE